MHLPRTWMRGEPTVCSLEDLEEGMRVHEAELRVTGDGTLIDAIEVVE